MKNKKLIITSIIIMIVGFGVLLFGLFSNGNIGKLKGAITDDTASFEVTFSCEKTSIALNEETTCVAYIDVGSNGVQGVQGTIVAGDGLTMKSQELLPENWQPLKSDGIINGSYSDEDNEKTGKFEYIRFVIEGTSVGTSALNMAPFGDFAKVSDGETDHALTSVPLNITVSSGSETADVNTLKSLTVSDGTLTPAFDSSVTEYSVSVNNNISTITINAEPTSDSATVDGTGEKALDLGDNIIEITVTSENGNDKVYSIVVTRSADESDYADTDLKSITINNGTLIPSFDKDITTYTVEVGPNVSEIGISVEPANATSTVTGTGTKQVTGSSEPILIEVTDSNGNVKTYTLTIVRKSDSSSECELSSEFYGIDNVKNIVSKVDLNDSDETIAKRLSST